MRAAHLIGVSVLVAAAAAAFAGDDEPPATDASRVPVTAPVEDLRAAIAERVALDGLQIEFVPKENVAVVRRAGAALGEDDPLLAQLRNLDGALARSAALRRLSDDELRAKLDETCAVPPPAGWETIEERDPVLLEIARRRGDVWRDRLRAKLEKLEEWRQAAAKPGDTKSWDAHDLELLTAIRRVEGKPDPVQMEVTPPEPCAFPDLPVVKLSMVNRDERTVMMTRGGDYRSGREGRYHVEARDLQGRLMPSFEWNHSGFGGGMYARELIATGEELGTSLPLAKYVAALDPGEYRIRIHYSDWNGIADADGFLGAVTVRSPQFTIRILPRVIETTPEEQAQFAALAEALPTKGPVLVLDDEYGEWAHELVPPESAAGKLSAAGWSAVPVLVRFVGRADAHPMRRAWAFAVLYGITGRLAPTSPSLIGDFSTHAEGLRPVSGGGLSRSLKMVSTPGGSDAIAPAAQAALAQSWAKVAAIVKLKETKK